MKTVATACALLLGLGVVAGCGGTSGSPPAAGLSPTPAADATGATSSVPTDTRTFHTSVEDMFRGRVSGLEVVNYPECGVALRIRGFGAQSLLSDSLGAPVISPCAFQPLLVIDGKQTPPGMRLDAALGGIRPDDVANIRVLKDLSETSIYGSRGAYGVVIITTKR